MHLANTEIWIIIVAVLMLLIGLIIWIHFRKKYYVNRIFSKQQQKLLLANYNKTFRIIRIIVLILTLLFVSFAILDPRWGSKTTNKQMEGIDIVLVTDISQSMLTPDLHPNRLEYSKLLSKQLMSLLLGNRIGLVGFAGFAFPVIPLTTDINAAMLFLDELSTDMIDVQGTNLEDAIKQAIALFEKNVMTHKAIIIMTDGEDNEFAPDKQARIARENGITIFTIGIGTDSGGKIPIKDEKGNIISYLMSRDGKIVTSKLNKKLLSKIAEVTGGFYIHGNETTIIKLAKHIYTIKKSRFGSNIYEYMEPQYQYFLLIAILLLLIYVWLPERKLNINSLNIGRLSMVLIMIFLSSNIYASDASDGVGEYRKENFTNALRLFQKSIVRKPDNKKLRYNEANTYYKLNKHDRAIASYISLTNSKNKTVCSKSLYNLGNTYLKNKDIKNALQAYKKVLNTEKPDSPIFKKALNNFIYAKKVAKQQQQQQQQQQQNNKQNQKQQNQQNQQQQNDKNKKQNQNQQQQQQQQKPISPSQIDNLLNLIEAEEKKHLAEKEKHKGFRIFTKQKW